MCCFSQGMLKVIERKKRRANNMKRPIRIINRLFLWNTKKWLFTKECCFVVFLRDVKPWCCCSCATNHDQNQKCKDLNWLGQKPTGTGIRSQPEMESAQKIEGKKCENGLIVNCIFKNEQSECACLYGRYVLQKGEMRSDDCWLCALPTMLSPIQSHEVCM